MHSVISGFLSSVFVVGNVYDMEITQISHAARICKVSNCHTAVSVLYAYNTGRLEMMVLKHI